MDLIAEEFVPMFNVPDDGKTIDEEDQARTPTPQKKANRRLRNRLNVSRVRDVLSSSTIGAMKASDSLDSTQASEDRKTFFSPAQQDKENDTSMMNSSTIFTPAKRPSGLRSPPSSGTTKMVNKKAKTVVSLHHFCL
jgi:hypothetical protein